MLNITANPGGGVKGPHAGRGRDADANAT